MTSSHATTQWPIAFLVKRNSEPQHVYAAEPVPDGLTHLLAEAADLEQSQAAWRLPWVSEFLLLPP
jgi:hypothetical protein